MIVAGAGGREVTDGSESLPYPMEALKIAKNKSSPAELGKMRPPTHVTATVQPGCD